MGGAARHPYGRPMRRRLPHLPWKRLLAGGAAVLVLLAGLVVGAGAWVYSRAVTSNVGDLDFANELAIPPLRARGEDALHLAQHFLLRFAARPKKTALRREIGTPSSA